MSCSKDQEVVAEHVKNSEYILLLKVDLICNEVLSFGDHVSINVFKNDFCFKEKLLTEARKTRIQVEPPIWIRLMNLNMTMQYFLLILRI